MQNLKDPNEKDEDEDVLTEEEGESEDFFNDEEEDDEDYEEID